MPIKWKLVFVEIMFHFHIRRSIVKNVQFLNQAKKWKLALIIWIIRFFLFLYINILLFLVRVSNDEYCISSEI